MEIAVAPTSFTRLQNIDINKSNVKIAHIAESRLRKNQLSVVSLLMASFRVAPKVFVIYGNINELAVHFLILSAKLRRIPVVVWTQYHRANSSVKRDEIKAKWVSLVADACWLYTDKELEEWRSRGHLKRTISLNNGVAVDVIQQFSSEKRLENGPFVFCARLEEKNGLLIALEGYKMYWSGGGRREFVIIGWGQQGEMLTEYLSENPDLEDAIKILGQVDKVDADKLISKAFFMLHPLAIGLSIVSAFSVGVPLIAHEDPRRHMPEFWLFENGATGLGFVEDAERELISGCAAALNAADSLSLEDYNVMVGKCIEAAARVGPMVMAERALSSINELLNK